MWKNLALQKLLSFYEKWSKIDINVAGEDDFNSTCHWLFHCCNTHYWKSCVTTVELYLAYNLYNFLTRQIRLPLLDYTKLRSPLSRTLCRMLMLRADTLRMEKSVLFSQTATYSHGRLGLHSELMPKHYLLCAVKILHLMVPVSRETSNNHHFKLC